MSGATPAAAAPGLDRADALRYAGATRRFLERRGRSLSPAVRGLAEAAAAELEAAAAADDRARLDQAIGQLDLAWRDHLSYAARKSAWREIAESVVLALMVALLLRAFVIEAFKIPSASMVPELHVGDHILVSKLHYGLKLPFANRWLLRWGEPRRGDVVVFANPREPGKDFVKRVVGLPGDVVELRDQVVYVDGVPQPREAVGDVTYDEQSDTTGQWWTDTCPAWRETLARGPLPPPHSQVPADLADSFEAAAAGGLSAHQVLQCRRSRLGEREGPFEPVRPGQLFVLGDNRDRSADSRGAGGWQVPVDNVKGKALLVWWSWGRSGWAPWRAEAGLRLERLFKRIE